MMKAAVDKYLEIFGKNKTILYYFDKPNSFLFKTKINKKFGEIMKRNIVVETCERCSYQLQFYTKYLYTDVGWGEGQEDVNEVVR